MRKIILFLLVLICANSLRSQNLTDSAAVRNYINTYIIPNGSRTISGAKMNIVLNGLLNVANTTGGGNGGSGQTYLEGNDINIDNNNAINDISTFQSVTDRGSATTNTVATSGGFNFEKSDNGNGQSIGIYIGQTNSDPSLSLLNSAGFSSILQNQNVTTQRTNEFPDHDGTFAVSVSLNGNTSYTTSDGNIDLGTVGGGPAWSLTGNASIDTSVNFIGTTINKDVIFKRNSIETFRNVSTKSTIWGYTSGLTSPYTLINQTGIQVSDGSSLNIVVNPDQILFTGAASGQFIGNYGIRPPTYSTTGRDASASTTAGNIIYNSDSAKLQFYNGSVWTNIDASVPTGGASGTVTVVSSGNLSPLFTTNVAASTTTPAISYTLSNASAHSLFGRASGTGVPSYLTSIDSTFIPALHTEAYYNVKYLLGNSNVDLGNHSINASAGVFVNNTTSSNSVRLTASHSDGFMQTAELDNYFGLKFKYGNTDVGGGISRNASGNNGGELRIYSDSTINNAFITIWTKAHRDMMIDSAGRIYLDRITRSTTSWQLFYDSTTKEVFYAPALTGGGGGGTGSGTVNSGTLNTLAYYNANGTAVSSLAAITANKAIISSSTGLPIASSVTNIELGYVSGVTSAIQTQLNAKQATITGAASTITTTNLTASRALISDGSGKIAVSTVTSTDLTLFKLLMTSQTLTDGATISMNCSNGYVGFLTIGGNRSISFSNFSTLGEVKLRITQDATGGRTLTFPANTYIPLGYGVGTKMNLTTSGSAVDWITVLYDGTNYYAMLAPNFVH